MGTPIGDMGKDRKIAIMVEQKMEFDSTLCLTIGGPVKQRDAQFNQCSIETEELIFEAELFLCGSNHPTYPQKVVKDRFVELP